MTLFKAKGKGEEIYLPFRPSRKHERPSGIRWIAPNFSSKSDAENAGLYIRLAEMRMKRRHPYVTAAKCFELFI